MRAMDVMTTNVITVSPDTSVQEVAKILSERSISGVPVVDAQNRLVGIVSEGDLLHRVEMGTDRRPDRRTGRRRSMSFRCRYFLLIEQHRFAVPAIGAALRRGTAIVDQREQHRLLRLAHRHDLRPTQRDDLTPEVAVAVDLNHARGHGAPPSVNSASVPSWPQLQHSQGDVSDQL